MRQVLLIKPKEIFNKNFVVKNFDNKNFVSIFANRNFVKAYN